jgi:hypothetical protein
LRIGREIPATKAAVLVPKLQLRNPAKLARLDRQIVAVGGRQAIPLPPFSRLVVGAGETG